MMERLFLKFAKVLARVYLGGAPYRPQKPLPEMLFYPVIFANGRDDDGEGLKAFYENRAYILRGEIFLPSHEPRRLIGLDITLSCHGIAFVKNGQMRGFFGSHCGQVLSVSVSHGLVRSADYCRFTLGVPVRP